MEAGEVGEGEGGEENEEEEALMAEEDEEPDMWEESFKGFRDSKPYGESSPFIKPCLCNSPHPNRSQLCWTGHVLPWCGACVWHP